MTISSNDAIQIARCMAALYQMHVPTEQILEKSDEQLKSLIMTFKAEGARVELLDCFERLFPKGLNVSHHNQLQRADKTALPIVSEGED